MGKSGNVESKRSWPKPTPGEWSYRNGEGQVWAHDDVLICTLSGLFSTRLANGNLIAKAPEMLELLRELVKCGYPGEIDTLRAYTAADKAAQLLAEIDQEST